MRRYSSSVFVFTFSLSTTWKSSLEGRAFWKLFWPFVSETGAYRDTTFQTFCVKSLFQFILRMLCVRKTRFQTLFLLFLGSSETSGARNQNRV